MNTIIFEGGSVIAGKTALHEGTVVVQDGVITYVGEHLPAGIVGKVIPLKGKTLAPGFMDVHIHGGGGGDWMDPHQEQWKKIVQTHAAHGTTGLLATTITSPLDRLTERISGIAEMIGKPTGGAEILGIHLEGPFLNPVHKGAHIDSYMVEPTLQNLEPLLEQANGQVKWVTLAPEKTDQAKEVLEYLTHRGVVCAIGHSDATHDQVCTCLYHGLSHVTHLYNAMRPFHHRETGIIGAALTREELSIELIVDGIHSLPSAVQMAVKAKGIEKTLLITDAIRATGMPDGLYELGGQEVIVQEGIARLANGTLAGSTLTMNRAVKNMIVYAGVSLVEAIQMASIVPAKKLGLDHVKGKIAEGYDADLVIVDDQLNVELTMVNGEIVYEKRGG